MVSINREKRGVLSMGEIATSASGFANDGLYLTGDKLKYGK